MDAETLKKKIDGLMIGLRSTNPGDINAIKDILYALAEGAGGGGAPVKLTAPYLTDYGFLSQLRERINAGLLFNTTIVYFEQQQSLPPGPKESVEYLPVSFNENIQEVRIARGSAPKEFIVPNYTSTQFEAMAAIQVALESFGLVDLVTEYMDPNEDEPSGEPIYLCDDGSGKFICVDGYLLAVETESTDDGDIVAHITKSNIRSEGEYGDITMEDAQKLIGIPINRV